MVRRGQEKNVTNTYAKISAMPVKFPYKFYSVSLKYMLTVKILNKISLVSRTKNTDCFHFPYGPI